MVEEVQQTLSGRFYKSMNPIHEDSLTSPHPISEYLPVGD
jgi:hypothetical protein